MTPPKQDQQLQGSKDQPNQPPSFVTEQALEKTLNNLVQEMRKELASIRSEIRSSQVPTPQPTPQPVSNQSSLPSQSAFSQPASSATQPIITQSSAESDKRWRPEEIGYFDGSRDADVYTFTDRLTSIAELKTSKVVQANLVTLLKDTAFNWYHYELTNDVKWALNASTSIDPWCQALIRRFAPSHSDLVGQLEASHYTRKDAATKKDATAYIQDLMRICKGLGWKQSDALMAAFHHFEPGLQRDLDPPTDLNGFIQQVQVRQAAWFQIYAGYGSSKPQPPRPPSLRPSQSYIPSRSQPPIRSSYSNQSNPQRQITYGPPAQPRAYWAKQEEDYNDYTYDAPSDAWIAVPEHEHGPGHTPRRWGNTHNGGGSEAMANWAAAGEDHRCTQQGCTHYH